MVTLETTLTLIQERLEESITVEELEEVLFDMGLELDGVQADNIKIDVTPDRPDLVSPQGICRALRAYRGKNNPSYTVKKGSYQVKVTSKVEKVRPLTVCAVIKNLKLDDEAIKEIIYVQEKLHATFGRKRARVAIGMYPMENIKWPITYTAKDPKQIEFIPLGKTKKMNGKELLEQTQAGKTYGHLLQEHKLYPVFIDAEDKVLSVPPILNSKTTGQVNTQTKEVFIECSGHQQEALMQTLNILCGMFIDMGGQAHTVEVKGPKESITTPQLETRKKEVSKKYIEQVIGEEFSDDKIKKLLEKMMHQNVKVNKDKVSLEILPFRTDIWHDIDIVDDVVRGLGINSLQPEMPAVHTEADLLSHTRITQTCQTLLIGLGLQEAMTFSLSNTKDQYEMMRVEQHKHVALQGAAEQSINMVRTWILPELLKSFKHNKSLDYPQQIFEIDDVVIPDSSKDVGARNERCISIALAGPETNFTKIKQTVDALLRSLNVKVEYEEISHESFIEGRAAQVKIAGEDVGVIGEIHPAIINELGIQVPIVGGEVKLQPIIDYLLK